MGKKKGRWFARRRYEKVNLKKRMVNGWREGVAISVLGFKYSSVSQMCNRVEFPGTVWILIFSGFHVCLLEKFPRSCGVQEKKQVQISVQALGVEICVQVQIQVDIQVQVQVKPLYGHAGHRHTEGALREWAAYPWATITARQPVSYGWWKNPENWNPSFYTEP